jgi:hypothetical protein
MPPSQAFSGCLRPLELVALMLLEETSEAFKVVLRKFSRDSCEVPEKHWDAGLCEYELQNVLSVRLYMYKDQA